MHKNSSKDCMSSNHHLPIKPIELAISDAGDLLQTVLLPSELTLYGSKHAFVRLSCKALRAGLLQSDQPCSVFIYTTSIAPNPEKDRSGKLPRAPMSVSGSLHGISEKWADRTRSYRVRGVLLPRVMVGEASTPPGC